MLNDKHVHGSKRNIKVNGNSLNEIQPDVISNYLLIFIVHVLFL